LLPKTLKEAHERLATAPSGMDVDAASAFLFNVERLVQCALLAAATCPECTYLTAPLPRDRETKRIDIPPAPEEPERLKLARMRVRALHVYDSKVPNYQLDDLTLAMGYDDSQAEKGKEREALLAELKYSEKVYAWLNEAIQAGVTPQDPPSRLDVYFGSVLKAALDTHEARVKEHESEWRGAWLENARRDAEAEVARRWERDAWPDVVAVANAVARSLLTDPPVLFANPVPTTPNRLTKAVGVWRAQGLAAVPLCELVAALVRMSAF